MPEDVKMCHFCSQEDQSDIKSVSSYSTEFATLRIQDIVSKHFWFTVIFEFKAETCFINRAIFIFRQKNSQASRFALHVGINYRHFTRFIAKLSSSVNMKNRSINYSWWRNLNRIHELTMNLNLMM